jgi:dolichol-phosphate mannosyltransferase
VKTVSDGQVPAVSVIILTYNERETLAEVADEIGEALGRLEQPFEILIVDDGSTDGSGAVADTVAGRAQGVRAIHHKTNQGLGGVYRTGFREALGRLVTFFPADGQFPASILADFVPCMGNADLVLGYLPGRPRRPLETMLSAAERLIYRALLGPIPTFQGIFMIRTSVLRDIELKSSGRGWAVVMELIIKVARDPRRRVVSMPTVVRPRASGTSKVRNFRTIAANLKQIVALRAHL